MEPNVWEIPASFSPDMRVPARLYADEDLLGAALEDRSIEQLVNTATLPGMVRYAIAMPDIHQGYGFPIGGVIATRLPDGVISPGGVGYDINCGFGSIWLQKIIQSLRALVRRARSSAQKQNLDSQERTYRLSDQEYFRFSLGP